MKKLAASLGLVVLAVTAQLALAKGTTDKTTAAAPDACGWTKGGGAAVGKTSAAPASGSALTVTGTMAVSASSSSATTSAAATDARGLNNWGDRKEACASASGGSLPDTGKMSGSSSSVPQPLDDQKIKTKSNIKND